MRKLLLIAQLIVGLDLQGYAQSSCGNADFEDGNFTNWSGFAGTCCPIATPASGIIPGRHTIMATPGYDPFTNNIVTYLAPDSSRYSARLGNDDSGAEAERLSYTFLVDNNSNLFIYRYAVVFEDPNHSAAEQPRFDIRVYDQASQLINCGTYTVVSGPANAGFIRNTIDTGIVFKDWTAVGIDLSAYLGTQVTIDFSVGDCQIGGHFGYAYLDCSYAPLTIITNFCPGSTVATLSAPEGFANYQWSTGETTREITINNPTIGTTYSCTITAVTGCTASITTVMTPTILDAEFNVINNCQNVAEFGNLSQAVTGPPIVNWLWIFGDGDTVSVNHNLSPSVIHVFDSAGTYNVTLIVTNELGCTNTQTISVNILANPVAAIESYILGFPGDTITFTDSSSANGAPISQWNWSIGNGVTLNNGPVVQHIFTEPGSFDLQYIVIDTNGCRDTLNDHVCTCAGSAGGFSYKSICGTSTIEFIDQISSYNTTTTSIVWDFGDGSPLLSGNIANPTHTFPAPGIYVVIQVVTSASGYVDTDTLTVIIPQVIQAQFISDTLACTGSIVNFYNNSIVSDSGFIQHIEWYFGDNDSCCWPHRNEYNPSHIYTSPGIYMVSMVITANNQCTDTVEQLMTIIGPDGEYSISEVCPGDLASINTQLIADVAPIVSEIWDFGDGTGSIPGPVSGHIFYVPGTYYVALTLVDSIGCTNVIRDTVQTAPIPFAYVPAAFSCTGSPSIFSSLSTIDSGSIILHQWEFGDGTPGDTGTTVAHTYMQPGNFRLSLFVESDKGCRDSVFKELTLYDPPIADFVTDTVCAGGVITCFDRSSAVAGVLSNWNWTLGDTNQIVVGQPQAQGAVPLQGPFVITLVVESSVGCSDTIQISPYVIPAPKPNFIFTSVCDGDSVKFTNASQLPFSPDFDYLWEYGDGDSTVLYAAPPHLYANWGTYSVVLTAHDSSINGCVASIQKNVTVHANPIVAVESTPPYCAIYEVAWRDSTWVPDGSLIQFWNWTFGNAQSSNLQHPVTVYTTGGLYDIGLNVETVYGCKGEVFLPGFLTVYPELTADFDFSPQNASVFQPEVFFYNRSIGADRNFWTFSDGYSTTVIDPVRIFTEAGSYLAELVVESDYGCVDTIAKKIDVKDDYTIFVPTAFTPNSDGKNDYFIAKSFNTSGFIMEIYDRWGAKVFRSDNIEIGWDGKYMDVDAPEDIYVYRMYYRDHTNSEKELVGKVALIR